MKIKRVLSGGQTGTDQAALQAAIDIGIEHGGWCPPGRISEEGKIPEHFNLTETPEDKDSSAPKIPCSQRTIWNVRDADATIIFLPDKRFDIGTHLSIHASKKMNKNFLVVDPYQSNTLKQIKKWLNSLDGDILNVSGPKESKYPGIYKKIYSVIKEVLPLN
ncbi:MAG: molybdenum cofactor carrier [Balneola sp.]|nr:MAG: molybdenum cofactor carrier [Balneola sp.]